MAEPEQIEAAQSDEKAPPTNTDPVGLIVFVHGLHPAFQKLDYTGIEALLKEAIEKHDGDRHDLYSFKYNGSYFSTAHPEKVAERLHDEISKEMSKGYKQLYLVGHSFGALLLRQAILFNATLEGKRGYWVDEVNKAIFLAGTNRGFQPYSRLYEKLASLGRVLQGLPSFLRVGQLAVGGLRGSPWVTTLRMEWVKKRGKLPFTVQIRGTQDKLVGPNDSRDLAVATNSAELDPIKNLGHRELALLNPNTRDTVKKHLEPYIDQALNAKSQAATRQVSPDYVVFLIHGIRDFAEWHEDLGETITRLAAKDNYSVEIVPISYGYFSALQFLFPIARRRCARSFLDRYVQYYARYPDAKFCALAHSNGTVALSSALQSNRFIDLENVFLAGSVLPRTFRWQDVRGKLVQVRNECSDADWPVSVLCWLLSGFYRELGTSGVFGFDGPEVRSIAAPNGKIANNFHAGGHSVALEPEHHEEIARFLLKGNPWSTLKDPKHRNKRLLRSFLRFCAAATPIGLGFLLCLIASTGWPSLLIVVITFILTVVLGSLLLLI